MHSDESEINFRWWLFCGGTMPFFSLPFFSFLRSFKTGYPYYAEEEK